MSTAETTEKRLVWMKNLHMMEDKFMGHHGLYLFWTCIYVAILGCLFSSDVTGSSRKFLLLTSLISMIFPTISCANKIYGNKLPSSFLLIGGPIYEYSFWMLLAYYRADVYGTDAVGVMNAVGTVITALFTADMLVKTWYYAIYPKNYDAYVEDVNKA